jgi:major membrane immunogen (membrane-anchored lipoprotein)
MNKANLMKLRTFYYCTGFLCAAMLAGCSTNTVVTLQDGTQYITKDAPDTKTKDGFYEFEDVSGKQVRIKANEVATVKEED